MPTKLLLTLTLVILSTGCASNKANDELARIKGENSQTLYAEGKKQLDKGNFSIAIKRFETLTARYPFSTEAQEAQLEIASAHQQMFEPDLAIAAADEFIKTNPRHKRVDYAYYLKGLVNSGRHDSFFDDYIKKDIANLDYSSMEKAFADFKLLIRRYPNSQYVDEARQRMIFLRNALARHELNVADYYMRRTAWVAAANRCQHLIAKYDRSDSVPAALKMMAEAYGEIGNVEGKNEALTMLKTNFPGFANEKKGLFQ